jgi:hypothetical protein
MAAATGAAPIEQSQIQSEEYLQLAKPFQFLNLGVMAYVGANSALAQIQVTGY